MQPVFTICAAIAIAAAGTALPAFANKTLTDSLPKPKLNGSNESAETARKLIKDPLLGVVINRTITVLGKDFYQYFTSLWRQKDGSENYTISIQERPTARFGSEIWVEYRQKKMFHAFLSPARSAAKDISQQAVEIVLKNITQNEVDRALFHSPDLGPEEL